ncbi:hypothetical protein D9619_010264 [Psilocybe cf. subviscida]|uniref:SHSP domain-containing protein n=1 Tax=Psilocybe cf. subviscida TaxID=2480587 RepID=A0A8H5ASW7_9AGAR|nr:hypothetical protein D9619_010264 [Psilocybe cf. subviscida]
MLEQAPASEIRNTTSSATQEVYLQQQVSRRSTPLNMSNVFFYEPFYDLERLVNQAFSAPFNRQSSGSEVQAAGDGAIRSFKPRMDLHEDKEKNLVTAQLEFPGVGKEDIQIDLQAGKLTVSAETKQSSENDENGYAVRERRFGKYSRTLQLPQGVKDDEIKASMENGILTVKFPKSASDLAPKRIAIN